MTLLADLAARRGTDLTVLDDAGLTSLGSLIGRGRRDLAAFATAVAGEAERRQASGSSPAPEAISDPDLELSTRARAKDAARGEIRHDLPEAGAGAESGAAKTENADHLADRLKRLSDTEKKRLAARDADIAKMAAQLRPEAFRTWLAKLIVKITDPAEPDELSPAERAKAAAGWAMFRRPDGTWAIAATMDDERGTHMDAAITARAREIANLRPPGERVITANDRAYAAYELLCSIALTTSGNVSHDRPDNSPPGETAHRVGHDLAMGPNLGIGIIIDAATLAHGPHPGTVAETWDGHPIDPLAAQRRACDADLYTILYDHLGRPTRVGRTRRHATREQRLQLRGLYPTCPIDGVTPFSRCHIHHLDPYQPHGETELDNLVPLSPTWHHRIHDNGWTLTMAADRSLRLYRPDKTLDRTIDPPQPITRHGP